MPSSRIGTVMLCRECKVLAKQQLRSEGRIVKARRQNQMLFSTIATRGSNLRRLLSSEGSGETCRAKTREEGGN